MWGHMEKGICKPGRGFLTRKWPCWHHDLDLQPTEVWDSAPTVWTMDLVFYGSSLGWLTCHLSVISKPSLNTFEKTLPGNSSVLTQSLLHFLEKEAWGWDVRDETPDFFVQTKREMPNCFFIFLALVFSLCKNRTTTYSHRVKQKNPVLRG